MAGYQDCVDAIKKAGRNLTEEDIEAMLSQINVRAKKFGDGPDATFKAAQELSHEAKLAAIQEKRQATINAARYADMQEFVATAKAAGVLPGDALVAAMGGIETPFKGARASVDFAGKSLSNMWAGGVARKLENAGLFKAARKGDIDGAIARELWELNSKDGKPGVTNNAQALEIAKSYRDFTRLAVKRQNNAGASIGSLDGYIVRQTHDMTKIRKAGYDEWAKDMKQYLDADRTFDGADPDEFLRGSFRGLTTGVHLKTEGAGSGKLLGMKGSANLAKKLSAERVLHFKDADAFMAYREKYGRGGTLLEDVVSTLDNAGKNTALMERFGTNPKAMFERIRDDLLEQNRDDLKAVDNLKQEHLNHLFAEISGETRIPGNIILAGVMSGIRNAQGLAKLGGAGISSLTDVATVAAETRYQGHGFLTGVQDTFAGLARRNDPETKEVLELLHAGLEGLMSKVASDVWSADSIPGALNRGLNLMFRINGVTAWTDRLKSQMQLMMSRRLGNLRDKAWDDIHPDTTRVLNLYGIDAPIWNMMRKHIRKVEDNHYFTADIARRIDDADIDHHLAPKMEGVRKAAKAAVDRLKERDAQEQGWIDQRVKKLNEMTQRHRDLVYETKIRSGEKIGKAMDHADAQIDLLSAQLERAEIEAEIQAGTRGLMDQNAMRQYLDNVEGGRTAVQVAKQTDGRLSKAAGANLSIGQELGRRQARVEDRIKLAETKLRKTVKESGQKIAAKTKELDERFAESMKEYADFLAGVKERRDRRASAMSSIEAGVEPQLQKMRENFRDWLETSIQTYFVDRADHTVATPSARERAMIHRGTRPGTIEGEALRLFWQFKSFPLTVMTKIYGRELRGGQATTWQQKAWNVGTYMALATSMGYAAMCAKDLSKGRSPRDPTDPKTWLAALAQSGGAGIYGDFIFGQASRFGNAPLETLAGPAISTGADIITLFQKARDGDAGAADVLNLAIDNTPFLSLPFARTTANYLFLYEIQESITPGYIKRMEKRMRKEQNQTFLFSPSQSAVRW